MKIFKKSVSIFLIAFMFFSFFSLIPIDKSFAESLNLSVILDTSKKPSAYCMTHGGSPITSSYSTSNYFCIDKSHDGNVLFMTYQNNPVYCIGTHHQLIPQNEVPVNSEADKSLDSQYARLYSAAITGFSDPTTNYSKLNDVDFYYVTQCAIRAILYDIPYQALAFYNIDGTINNAMTEEFINIMIKSRTALTNSPQISVNENVNKEIVSIENNFYYKIGPYQARPTSGQFETYSVLINGHENSFASKNPSLSTIEKETLFNYNESFYVYTPANTNTSLNIEISSNTFHKIYTPTVLLAEDTTYQNVFYINHSPNTSNVKTNFNISSEVALGSLTINKTLLTKDGIISDEALYKQIAFTIKNIDSLYLNSTSLNGNYSFSSFSNSSTIYNLDEKGSIFINNIPIGDYFISEIQGASGFSFDSNPIEISVTPNNNFQKEIVNNQITTSLKIAKNYDSYLTNEQLIKNLNKQVTFTVLNSKNEPLMFNGEDGVYSFSKNGLTNILTLDTNGNINLFDLPIIETYKVVENSTINGLYCANNNQSINLAFDKENILNFTNNLYFGALELNKFSEDTKSVENITFNLKGTSLAGVSIDLTATTDKNGKAYFSKLPIGNYEIFEIGTSVNDSYLTADKQSVTITANSNSNISFFNYLKKGNLKLTKKDFYTSKTLSDCKIKVYNEDNTIIYEGFTDENGEIKINGLPIGKYTYQEAEAPKNYILDDTIYSFEIKENGEEATIIFTNKNITKVKEANSPKTSDNSSVLYIYILSAISIIVASTSYKNRKVNKN